MNLKTKLSRLSFLLWQIVSPDSSTILSPNANLAQLATHAGQGRKCLQYMYIYIYIFLNSNDVSLGLISPMPLCPGLGRLDRRIRPRKGCEPTSGCQQRKKPEGLSKRQAGVNHRPQQIATHRDENIARFTD